MVPQELTHRTAGEPVPPLPGMDPKELKEGLEQMCLSSGYAALAPTANVWKPPDGPWAGEERNHVVWAYNGMLLGIEKEGHADTR